MSTEMHDSAQRSLRGGEVFFVINVGFTIEVTFRQDKTYGKIQQAVPKDLKKIKVELMNNNTEIMVNYLFLSRFITQKDIDIMD